MELSAWLDSQKDPPAERVALAEACHVNLSTIYKWEKKKRKCATQYLRAITLHTKGRVAAADMRPDLARAMGR